MRVTSVAGKRFSIKPLRCGFTLVEIMMVMAAIGILVTLAIPIFTRARLLSRVSAQINDLHDGRWESFHGQHSFRVAQLRAHFGAVALRYDYSIL